MGRPRLGRYIECAFCGKVFYASRARLNNGTKFCSHKCYSDYNITKAKCTCGNCGKKFEVARSQLNYGRGKYCSPKCQFEAKRAAKVKRICPICKTEFEIKPFRITQGRGKYCSDKCYRRGRPQNGEHNPMWRGGKSFEPYCPKFNEKTKEEVRETFGRRCYLCGAPENGKHLHVHHCDYNKSQGCTGQRWSLIPLCNSCHAKTNGKRYHWFALLRDYWLNEYLDFVSGFPLF